MAEKPHGVGTAAAQPAGRIRIESDKLDAANVAPVEWSPRSFFSFSNFGSISAPSKNRGPRSSSFVGGMVEKLRDRLESAGRFVSVIGRPRLMERCSVESSS